MVDADYMKLTIELAGKAAGYVSPDPMVGAVIVKDGEIVGQGYYRKYGEPHAEAVAIREAKEKCRGATIYTNLEPCCHQGKNPPCTDAIIKAGIKRVVSSISDPNPKVNSGGFAKLRDAGIKVESGLMEREATDLNEVFLKYVTTKMPFVLLKLAQTADSKIAQPDGNSKWITCEESRREVHRMRAQYDAVVIGANTARLDNPLLTVRDAEGCNPKRIIVAGFSPLPTDLRVFSDEFRHNTIVACPPERSEDYTHLDGVTVWEIDKSSDGHVGLMNLLIRAGKERISSLLIEGGSRLVGSFLMRKLVDKICIFTAPILLGCGLPAIDNIGIDRLERAIELRGVNYRQTGTDILTTGYPAWR